MIRILAIILLAASVAPATAQQTRTLTADKHNEYGLVYSLPVTSLRFEVTARHTVSKAGPYRQYAARFIGTDRVVTEDAEQWEILSVKATPFGSANPEKQYLMQLKPGALTSITVAEDGMLLGINAEGTISGLPVYTLTEGGIQKGNPVASLTAGGGAPWLEYVNEDFLASKSSAKQAQLLSESLMEVRDAKVSLTRGTAETMPTDGRQLELMLESLRQQEAAMTAAFTGTTESETVTRTYIFTPGDEGRSVLFRMSDFAGFVGPDDYSGEPVYVSVQVGTQPELPVDSKGEVKKLPKDAVMYCIPGVAKVKLSFAGADLWSGDVECAQYGIEFGLAPNLFSDKKARSAAIFNPATGALVELGVKSEE